MFMDLDLPNTEQATINHIIEARKSIKENTYRAYIGYYKTMYRLYHNLDSLTEFPKSVDWLYDIPKIKSIVEARYKRTTQKNIYNALVVILSAENGQTDTILDYSALRDEAQSHYEKQAKSHTKSEKQAQNWLEIEDVDKLLKYYKKEANRIYKKYTITMPSRADHATLQEYIILLTHRNIPMRNDLANMRVVTPKEFSLIPLKEKESNNYLVGSNRAKYTFHINDYKTKKTFGNKVITIPKHLNREIRKYMRYNTSGYFITNSKYGPITPNGITKMFTKMFQTHFNKNISTSMLRHIYLSSKYKDDLVEKQKDSHNMGHSLDQQQDYIKV